MGVEVAAVFITLAKVIGPSIASSLIAKALEKTAGKLWGLKKAELERRIEKASGDAFMDFARAFPKGKAIGNKEMLERFFDSVTLKEELGKVVFTDHQTPNLHTLYQAFLEAGYTEDMLPGFDFDDAMNAFMDKFREELADVIQHRRNEEEGILKLYLDQVADQCGRLDFVGIPELRDKKRGLRVDEIFVTLRARKEVPEADILPEEEIEEEDVPGVRLRRARGESQTREAAPVELNDALRDNDKVVILGGPGAGKTTMLRYVALMLAQDDGEDSEEKLGLSRELVPIFLELGRFAGRDDQGQSLVEFMYDYMNTCLSVTLPPNFFEGFLDQGRCVVLLDGLDEVATLAQRVEVKNAVTLFANRYRGNKFVVTSRSAGYREAPLSQDFKHFTVCDFTEEDIKDFAGKWYRAREGDTEDVQGKADDLVKAIEDNRRVAALARNPLMLTIIALIHRIEARLPNQRIKLYDKCTESLLYTWEAVKRRGEEPASEEEKRSRCEKIAYWMQDMPGTGERERTVRRGELQEKLARILREEGIPNMREARAEAKHFLDQIRRRTGVLIEQGRDLYSFAHLTFQEYFAACEVYNRLLDAPFTNGIDSFWDEEMKPRLHDPRWQEAILLFMGKVSAGSSKGASDLVRRILEAESPYDDILHRDLLLAGRCLADDVAVDEKLRKRILDEMFEQFWQGKYRGLRSRAMDVLTAMSGSRYEGGVAWHLVKALDDDDRSVRSRAAEALGNLGAASEGVIDALIKALGEDDTGIRSSAADALGKLGTASEDVVNALTKALTDKDRYIASSVVEALDNLGVTSAGMIDAIVRDLKNENNNVRVRSRAAEALGKLGTASEEVIHALIEATRIRMIVFTDMVDALIEATDMVDALIKALGNKEWIIRKAAATALGRIGDASESVIDALMKALCDEDSDVRKSAGEALGWLGAASQNVAAAYESEYPSNTALSLSNLRTVSGDSVDFVHVLAESLDKARITFPIRASATEALGSLGLTLPHVIHALTEALDDEEWKVRSCALYALGKLGTPSEDVVNYLIKILNDEKRTIRFRPGMVRVLENLEVTSAGVIDAFIRVLDDEDGNAHLKSSAAYAMGSLGVASKQVMNALIKALHDGNRYVRSSAASALGKLEVTSEEVINALTEALHDESRPVRSTAASSLGDLGVASGEIINALMEGLHDENRAIRSTAASALGRLGFASGEVINALMKALHDESRYTRLSAAFSLGKLGSGRVQVMNLLLEKLGSENDLQLADTIFESISSLAAMEAG